MYTPTGSNYDKDIRIVCTALEHAGFQPSTQTNHPIITNTNGRKRSRKTSSSEFTSYSRLAQHFGLSSADAAVKLGETTGKRVKRGTFRNSCRYVRITEWPWIPKRRTTRASSDHETQVNPTASGTSSFRAPVATENSNFGTITSTEYTDSFSSSIPSWDTTTEASLCENIMTQIEADDTTSLVNTYGTEYMGSGTSSFGSSVATEYGRWGISL
ncbi:uncharacterized protein LOC143547075 isoform X2 [Bidens hawaiensis]|uniref:uncharacterized protein LOC143547075 isoform X2 n=1 Tax=Bidens hawaiensis TaxID=980011 RepID=UPI00404AF85B